MAKVAEKLIRDGDIIVLIENYYDTNKKEEYIEQFDNFKSKGVVLPEVTFDSKVWYMTDGLALYSVNFKINEFTFVQQKKKRGFTFDLSDIENALKYFTLIKLRNRDISTVKAHISYIKSTLEKTNYFDIEKLKAFRQDRHGKNATCLVIGRQSIEFLDFFSCLHIEDRYNQMLEEWGSMNIPDTSRDLPSFASFFKFGEMMNQFYEMLNVLDDNGKLKYEAFKLRFFPLILWWKITTHIPTRNTEFTVTPYDCIRLIDGKYMLTLMKTLEKGRHVEIEVSHNFEDSFYPVEVEVNREIYDLVNEYKTLVDKYDFIENFYYYEGLNKPAKGNAERRKFLLSLRGHYMTLNSKSFKATINNSIYINDYYPADLICNTLSKFYELIIENHFGLKVIEKGSGEIISDDEIEIMQPLDTRHFSIMNLLMQDVSPIVVKKLAGHNTLRTTYGYTKHIDEYIENYSYQLAKSFAKQRSNHPVMNLKFDLSRSCNERIQYYKEKIESRSIKAKECNQGKGWCVNQTGNLSECQVVGFECNGCRHYVSNNIQSIDETLKSNRDKIIASVTVLEDLIRNRKKIKDFEKQYKTQISKIKAFAEQSSTIIYEQKMNNHIV